MRRLAVSLAVLALAACKTSTLPNDPRQMPEMLTPKPASEVRDRAGYVAPLRGIGGSSAQGSVTATERDGGMVVQINITNVTPGVYAWALHANGNCTSTNGFSAGPAWVPKGVRKFAVDLLPEFVVNADQSTLVTARVRDAQIGGDGGISGRSVLVYQGGGIQPIKPGVPNNAVACGVFEPARPIF